jgi:hypothetical protein
MAALDATMNFDELHNLLSRPGFGLREPRASLATRTSIASATLPCALRSFSVLVNLPRLDGAARYGCTRLPLSFFFLLFLLFVVMRLDGEEQGCAYDEQLERDKDDGNPIHDFLNTLHQQPGRWFKRIGCCMGSHDDPFARSRHCAKTIAEITGSDSPKNSESDEQDGAFPGSFL